MTIVEERRDIARRLREFTKDNQWPLTVGGNSSTIRHAISDIVFGDKKYHSGVDLLDRLADLIEPTCEARKSTLFYPASSSVPEYEETVYRCGRCGEIVSYDEDYDPETDLPAYCERCGSRITGIGEPWDE